MLHELEVHQIELEVQNEELLQSQRELESARNRYFDLYDFAPVGYATLNQKDLIMQVNLTATTLLRTERKDLVRQPVTHFIAPESQDTFYLHLQKLRELGNKQDCQVRLKLPDTDTLWVRLDMALIGNEVRLGITDISERKQAEEKIEKLNKFLVQRTEELGTANKELEGFSFSISQDLKTPLRHLESFSRILMEDYKDKLDDKGRLYLQRLQNASQLATRYLDDLRLLAEISSSEIGYSTIDLTKIAQTASLNLEDSAPERRVEWVIEPGLKGCGDLRLLRIAIGNLLDNAFKFTGKISPARIEFGAAEINDKKTFFVRDNGIGFDMAYADKLFAPFRRLHNDKDFPGTGIGLAIVQRIIHRHGGQVWAKSEPRKGATFYFTLG